MAWIDPVSTGRTTALIRVEGVDAWRGRSITITTPVDGPQTWTESRANVSLFVLQDEHGLTEREARAATLSAVTLWAQETGWGRHEWNWNVSNLHCASTDATGGDCVRFESDDERLQAFDRLADGVRAFWDRVDRIELAMRSLAAGGRLDPLLAPSGPWASFPADDARSIWDRVAGYLAQGSEEMPPNPYRTGDAPVRRVSRKRWSGGLILGALAAGAYLMQRRDS